VSDYLSEEEQLSKLREWWNRNGTALVVGFVVVIAGVLGWRWYQSYTAEQLTQAADLYAEFTVASGEARDRLASEIVSGGKGTAYPALVLLAQAQEVATAGDLAAAEGHLAAAVAQATGAPLADLARLRLARVQHGLGRHDDALKTLGEIRSAGYLSVAQELKGDIHLARDERSLAHAAYLAALAEVLAEDQRALLEIKVADTADASGS
jgi:predicted negative regulator of RcsB-dependent stress response